MPTDLYNQRLPLTEWVANINATLDLTHTAYHPRPFAGLERDGGANRIIVGCAGPYFALERWVLGAPHDVRVPSRRCVTLSNVGTPVQMAYAGGTETLGRGESCILPAGIGEVRITPQGAAQLIACYVPDLGHDVIAPLRAAGYAEAQIAALGDIPSSSKS